MVKKFSEELKSLFRMDRIRLSKFVEIFQFTALSFFMGFFFGSSLNKIIPEVDDNVSTPKLILDLLFQLFILAIALYYSEKILKIVRHHFPLILRFSKKYRPCAKGECILGVTLGFSLSFIGSMENFHDKVKLLHNRIFHTK
jgi:hypothetical protein